MIAKVLFFSLALAATASASHLREEEHFDIESEGKKEKWAKNHFKDLIPQPSLLDEDVIIEAYMGEWFLTYTSLLPSISFLKDGYCISAQYDLLPSVEGEENKVSFTVTNSQRKGSFSGDLESIDGVAKNQVNQAVGPLNGLFYLKFDDMRGSSYGTYVIQALGPLIKGQGNIEQYQWAVVSDITRTDSYILVRKRMDTAASDVALAKAKSMGFDSYWNKPKSVPQAESCNKPNAV